MSGYIPQNAAQFDLFVQNLLRHVGVNLSRWSVIPQAAMQRLTALHGTFHTALNKAKETPTSAYINARNTARKELESAIREFVNQYLRFAPVTDLDRDKMRIPNKNNTRTARSNEVNEKVDFVIQTRGIRKLVVDFWQHGKSSKAKPRGYDGAVVLWHIGSEKPESPNDFRYHATASRTPMIIDFEENERGQKVWIALCWQNSRSIRGRWSEFKSTIVP